MPKLLNDRARPALCPFCRAEVRRPLPMEAARWYDFAGGFCECGATFALDPTARNGGGAFLQALLMASDGDMDRAMGLGEGEDYEVGYVEHYDSHQHRVDANAFGTLYFVKLRAGAGPA